MVLVMKVIGIIIKQWVKANSVMKMEMYMKVNGRIAKPMDMVFIQIQLEPDMKVHGTMNYSTVLALKFGKMVLDMKVAM